MPRHHVMTARRKIALRKAQLASAKKRRRHRIARNIAVGVGSAAVLGTAAYGGYKYARPSYYHHTSSLNARRIVAEQRMQPAEFLFTSGDPHGGLYFTSKRTGRTRKAYGGSTVKVTMSRAKARKIMHKSGYQPDYSWRQGIPERHYYANPADINGLIKIKRANITGTKIKRTLKGK